MDVECEIEVVTYPTIYRLWASRYVHRGTYVQISFFFDNVVRKVYVVSFDETISDSRNSTANVFFHEQALSDLGRLRVQVRHWPLKLRQTCQPKAVLVYKWQGSRLYAFRKTYRRFSKTSARSWTSEMKYRL